MFQRVIYIRCSLLWNIFMLKQLNYHSPVLLLLPFLICSYSSALLSPNSFLARKKQWVMTESNILANAWPLPWHSVHTRDWKDLPDCETGDSRDPWTSLYKSMTVVWIEGNKIMILGGWVLCWSSMAILSLYSYCTAQAAILLSFECFSARFLLSSYCRNNNFKNVF